MSGVRCSGAGGKVYLVDAGAGGGAGGQQGFSTIAVETDCDEPLMALMMSTASCFDPLKINNGTAWVIVTGLATGAFGGAGGAIAGGTGAGGASVLAGFAGRRRSPLQPFWHLPATLRWPF
ncbi:MAG: hypothetical protein AAB640_02135 [Patescibacteria group bacterium]